MSETIVTPSDSIGLVVGITISLIVIVVLAFVVIVCKRRNESRKNAAFRRTAGLRISVARTGSQIRLTDVRPDGRSSDSQMRCSDSRGRAPADIELTSFRLPSIITGRQASNELQQEQVEERQNERKIESALNSRHASQHNSSLPLSYGDSFQPGAKLTAVSDHTPYLHHIEDSDADSDSSFNDSGEGVVLSVRGQRHDPYSEEYGGLSKDDVSRLHQQEQGGIALNSLYEALRYHNTDLVNTHNTNCDPIIPHR